MKPMSVLVRTLSIGVLFAQIPQSGNALELSESSLAIVTQDSVAPANGTLTLLGVSYALPAGAQTVAGVHSPGNVVLLVRASLSTGTLFSLAGSVEGDDPQPGGSSFCCIMASGYTPNSERIPGPDEFFPWAWTWFFDDFADPGLLAAGETVELWVSLTDLAPGNRIEFFAYGPSPEPCNPGNCQPFGVVTVRADSVPLLDGVTTLALVLSLSVAGLAYGRQLTKPKLERRAS